VCLSQVVSEVAGFGGVHGGPQARTGRKSTTRIDYSNGKENSTKIFVRTQIKPWSNGQYITS